MCGPGLVFRRVALQLGLQSPIGKPADPGEEYPTNRTLQNSLTTCLICRPGAAGAPGWRQQGPAKQAHTRLNEIRLALLHFVLVSACSPNEPCMVYAWTRTFLPSTSRVWTSQCVSVGLGSTLLVGMVQWDQRVQGECVKPVCDFGPYWTIIFGERQHPAQC